MRIRWREFELPTHVSLEQDTATEMYGHFVAEPFVRGFGQTIGNGLRRVLLSSIEGTAVTRAKIDGAVHEFTALPGIYEDVADIVLNIKCLRVKMAGDGPETLTLSHSGAGPVTAADIECPADVEIVNKDLVLCTLTDAKAKFSCELEVEKGRGYRSAEENAANETEIGVIPVDGVFSPVYRVKYGVEATRVGKSVDFDRLNLEIWTNGTVSPELALVEASKIYRKHLNPFVQYTEMSGDALVLEGLADGGAADDDADLRNASIDILDLSVRSRNCLDSEEISTVGQLADLSEQELLDIRHLGSTSIDEIKGRLAGLGLGLAEGAAV